MDQIPLCILMPINKEHTQRVDFLFIIGKRTNVYPLCSEAYAANALHDFAQEKQASASATDN
ncbi:hypothetical protein FHS14_005773 [Paenibacillus baekrokdamisoli]|uniref:hypothetical protein n=1 Tax=Paenibacillus baekrokdamisoli TaxID=1712516 RepID=UPI000F765DAC|nr:hypothetical protein [Paenibacillus baekrokdamisoli]MBB3072737.1 hypothetical protein [Paenibacillus baekrokdamisoli]